MITEAKTAFDEYDEVAMLPGQRRTVAAYANDRFKDEVLYCAEFVRTAIEAFFLA